MAIGEAGTLTRGGFGEGEEVRVDFDQPITDAVIMLTGTNAGDNEFSLTITSVDANGFTFLVDEWEDEDGLHPATETINWLAVTPGVHTLPDGRIIEAGTTTATDTPSAVTLNGGFTDPPVVLTNVMSYNETDVVDSDPNNVTAGGFDVSLQEGSLSDGVHAPETVGYIAIAAGSGVDSGSATTADGLGTGYETFDLDGTVPGGLVFAEPQTLNDPDAGNVVLQSSTDTTANLKFDEETGDGESAHPDETVGIFSFQDGLIMCFTPDGRVETPLGPRRIADLAAGDLILTQDNGPKPLKSILSKTMAPTSGLLGRSYAPVVIKKDALGAGVPDRDLTVSTQHRMLLGGWRAQMLFGVEEVLVPAKSLINDHSILQPRTTDPVTYVHLVFDDHELVTVNNALSESLHAGDMSKADMDEGAREDLFTIFPELRCTPQAWRPTARRSLTVHEGLLLA